MLSALLKKSKGDAGTLKALWQMGKLDAASPVRKRTGTLGRDLVERLKSGGHAS